MGPLPTIAAATGTAPPVDASGALEPAEIGAWSTAADSTSPVMTGADTDGTTGDCGGGADADPVAFTTPCDNEFAPAAAGWPVIIPAINEFPN
ncbi:hypothetical protein BMG05_05285 [Mycobacterium malmoense]|nr:hypothetical protein BMG05_05285 [Mycobacterium malmoense]